MAKKEFDVLITTTAKMDTFQFETESTLLLFTINMSVDDSMRVGRHNPHAHFNEPERNILSFIIDEQL